MSSNAIDWARELKVAVTVTDAEGVIVEMNARSIATFSTDGGATLIGKDVRDCHPAAARERIDELIRTQQPNHYTIRKNGQRKIIHQLPWFDGGRFAGLVEISVPLPDELPHFER